MNITQAIDALVQFKLKHGDVEVFADCPKCGESFVFGYVEVQQLRAKVTVPKVPEAAG